MPIFILLLWLVIDTIYMFPYPFNNHTADITINSCVSIDYIIAQIGIMK